MISGLGMDVLAPSPTCQTQLRLEYINKQQDSTLPPPLHWVMPIVASAPVSSPHDLLPVERLTD